MWRKTEIVGQLLFFTLPFIHILFSFFNKVNRLSGPWNQEAFTFFSPYFSVKKKKLILTFHQMNYYLSLRSMMKTVGKSGEMLIMLNEKQMQYFSYFIKLKIYLEKDE